MLQRCLSRVWPYIMHAFEFHEGSREEEGGGSSRTKGEGERGLFELQLFARLQYYLYPSRSVFAVPMLTSVLRSD